VYIQSFIQDHPLVQYDFIIVDSPFPLPNNKYISLACMNNILCECYKESLYKHLYPRLHPSTMLSFLTASTTFNKYQKQYPSQTHIFKQIRLH